MEMYVGERTAYFNEISMMIYVLYCIVLVIQPGIQNCPCLDLHRKVKVVISFGV